MPPAPAPLRPLLLLLLLLLLRAAPPLRVSLRDGVAPGHVAQWRIDGRVLNATTLSLRPLAFEIPGFLSAAECAELRRAAAPRLVPSTTINSGVAAGRRALDMDGDGALSADELLSTINVWHDVALSERHVRALLADAQVGLRLLPAGGGGGGGGGDGAVAVAEVEGGAMRAKLQAWVSRLAALETLVSNRVSSQTFLDYLSDTPPRAAATAGDGALPLPVLSDALRSALRRRLADLTQLPGTLLGAANAMLQVVSYGAGEHYNAHLDSGKPNGRPECCHLKKHARPCKPCRFLTVLYYLNGPLPGGETSLPPPGKGLGTAESDVLRGGETVFPWHDSSSDSSSSGSGGGGGGNTDADEALWRADRRRNDPELYCDPASGAELRVRPEMGKAVLFYNHVLDEGTGWKGARDLVSFHGSCPVRAGRKWLANHWVQLADAPWEEVALRVRQQKELAAAAVRRKKRRRKKKKKKRKKKKKKAADEL
jgi:hypoxia-inducible factor prolyl 4-hydroxylase